MNALLIENGFRLAAAVRRWGEIEVQGLVEFTGHELGGGFEPPSCRA
jgi:hypothetical protein